ncbi:MAG: CNNM domain-containing protein [Kiritimatiellaeota bacterium]|nr:CNNM domain-containing protein [Kiritimatiellota bacterium]
MSPSLQIIFILLGLLMTAFFAGIETGLISINRLRLRHLVRRKVPGAAILQSFLQRPDDLLGTTLVGLNIGTTVAAVLATSIGLHLAGVAGEFAADVIMIVLILIIGEYIPKAWFQSFPARRCLPFARLLDGARWVLKPLHVPLMGVVKLFLPRATTDKAAPFVTREELFHLATEGQTSGVLTAQEHRMIHSVFELKMMTCREVMTPREKIIHLHADTPVAEILEIARVKSLNRLPVYDDAKRQFIGVVNIFDVLCDDSPTGKTARAYMRPPQLVADHTPVDHVLPRMRVTRQPMVLVVDERMEVIGLVTLADVLDEILGN